MRKENRPLISDVKSLSETSGKVFVVVGAANDTVKRVAAEKKAYLTFYSVASLDGHNAGDVVVADNGVVTATLAAGGDLDKFVSDNAYPTVGQLTPENYQFYMERGLDMFWFGLKLDDSLDANVKVLNEAVVGHEGKYSYVYLDYEKFEGFLSQQMGCTAVNCGVLVKNNVKYRLSDNGDSFSVEGIKAFLARDAEGKLEQFLKSQDVPAVREEDNVVVLVGKNFEQEVKGKNVFVFFYAPWCGHCKNAKPD